MATVCEECGLDAQLVDAELCSLSWQIRPELEVEDKPNDSHALLDAFMAKHHLRHLIEAHHIVPRYKGGTDDPENIRMLCRRCHRKYTNELLRRPRNTRRAG